MTKKEEKKEKIEQEEEIYSVESVDTTKGKPTLRKITFKSLHRGSLLFLSPDHYIKFINHLYSTNDPEIIEAIRTHPMFGQEFFEGEFPDWVKEKFQKDKQYISYFNPDEEIVG